MESKALVKSTNNNVAWRFFARTPSRILRMVSICEVVDLFLRKPFWFFLRMLSILGSVRFRSRALDINCRYCCYICRFYLTGCNFQNQDFIDFLLFYWKENPICQFLCVFCWKSRTHLQRIRTIGLKLVLGWYHQFRDGITNRCSRCVLQKEKMLFLLNKITMVPFWVSIRFVLVSLFNGISTLFKLFNAKAILLEEQ